jgi:RNA polymerase sigma-70 factor (ECF subfamily)
VKNEVTEGTEATEESDDGARVVNYLRTRDPTVFRVLVDRHAASVLRLVSSILGPFRDTDAEDVAQDVFVRAHDKLGQFRGDAQFGTWLYRIAYSVALNRRKLARLRMPHVAVEALAGFAAPQSPHDEAEAAQRASQLAAAIEVLPDLYRTVIYLHYWQESSVEEIARFMGAPENTVKSYLFRARARLATVLAEKGITS